jgi:uncharacterized protein
MAGQRRFRFLDLCIKFGSISSKVCECSKYAAILYESERLPRGFAAMIKTAKEPDKNIGPNHIDKMKIKFILFIIGSVFIFANLVLAQIDGKIPLMSADPMTGTARQATPAQTAIPTAVPTIKVTPAPSTMLIPTYTLTPIPTQLITPTKDAVSSVSEENSEKSPSPLNIYGIAAIIAGAVAGGFLIKSKISNQDNKKNNDPCGNIRELLERKKREFEKMIQKWPEDKLKGIVEKKIESELNKNEAGRQFLKAKKQYDKIKKAIDLLQKKYDLCTLEFPKIYKKRVYIIHGWEGYPEEGWFPWLKKELESRGFEVHVPVMPNSSEPKIETWVPFLSKLIGLADLNTFFVGHSIGCQAIIRYLETFPEGVKIGGAVFVAGWYNLRNLETEEEKRIAGPWVNNPRDDEKIRKAVNKAVAIFSDNDPFVMAENQESWRKKVGAMIIVEHNKGHFSGSDGITELPIALDSLLEISR